MQQVVPQPLAAITVGIDRFRELHSGDITCAHEAVEDGQKFLLLCHQFPRPDFDAAGD